MKQDNRRFISQETGNLYIAKVEPSDVGNYTCVVYNTVTKTQVQGPPTPLVLRNDGKFLVFPILCPPAVQFGWFHVPGRIITNENAHYYALTNQKTCDVNKSMDDKMCH